MRRQITSLAIMLISVNYIIAQDVNFGIKAGGLRSKFNFRYYTESLVNKSYTNNTSPSFSIFGEGKITKLFYIGVELGRCSYKGLIDIKYTYYVDKLHNPFSSDAELSYYGLYQQEQFYFSINPQIKLGKYNWLSVGGGIGFYNNYINLFHSGLYTFKDSLSSGSMDLAGHNLRLPFTKLGLHLNITANPRITKHLGLIFETKYIYNSPSNDVNSLEIPAIRFNSFAFMTGLSFHL